MSNKSANRWESVEATTQERTTFGYLNVTLEVAEGVFIQLPINCPLDHEIARMSKNQRKLMKVLEGKISAFKESGDEKDLIVNCPVQLKISVVNNDDDEDGVEFTL